ncbi:hypothetical protein [Aeromicrobium sp.]|jgi:hypothetical protein|uniref:hypothetical protein n=1 Tax=Aeromicrobium sp. TaxID=1871063 RepID=UPI0025B7B92F|nr:hypothetical protein [Aeromicrobium sp.]MCK5891699.1 hypothetical protein [Aeromicrobium sp.]
MNTHLTMVMAWLLSQLTGEKLRHDERGVASEVIWMGLLAAAAITAGVIITAKLISEANGIDLG